MIGPGDKVFLRACRTGEPGMVIRQERRKVVVYWADMDYWSRHPVASLELASAGVLADGDAIEAKSVITPIGTVGGASGVVTPGIGLRSDGGPAIPQLHSGRNSHAELR